MSVNVKSGGSRVVLANKAQNYVLPVASDSTLGGIKVGENLSIDANGILAATDTIYELPAATTSTLGGVIIDNSTITVDNDGTIHAVAYVLPTASTSTLGGIKVGDNLSVETDGTLNAVDPVSIIIDTQAGNDSTYSSNKILQLINAIKSFDVEIVAKLPTVGDPHKIYFVLRKQLEEENIYDEYMYINEEWEKIGSTEIHISIATTDTAGIVKPDGITITVAADGTISAVQYTLPAATTSTLGGVKADGTTITVDNDGTIHSSATGGTAADTTYDNTESELTADNVQDAIDEVNGKIPVIDVSIAHGSVNAAQSGATYDAINNVDIKIGDLTDLDTTDKTSTVNAINEVNNSLGGYKINADYTQEEYDALSVKDPNTLYFIKRSL